MQKKLILSMFMYGYTSLYLYPVMRNPFEYASSHTKIKQSQKINVSNSSSDVKKDSLNDTEATKNWKIIKQNDSSIIMQDKDGQTREVQLCPTKNPSTRES